MHGPVTHETQLTLASLRVGEMARITGVVGLGENPVAQRLCDLGFLPGTEVLLKRRAPLRDPSVFELRGVQCSLRKSEAARVIVEQVNLEQVNLEQVEPHGVKGTASGR